MYLKYLHKKNVHKKLKRIGIRKREKKNYIYTLWNLNLQLKRLIDREYKTLFIIFKKR